MNTKLSIRLFTVLLLTTGILLVVFFMYEEQTRVAMNSFRTAQSHSNSHLTVLLQEEVEEKFNVEKNRADFFRTAWISMLILLLVWCLCLSWIARAVQEALKQSNKNLEDFSHTLEYKVEERTETLSKALDDLQKTHTDLQNAQTQLLQSEKFAAVGQLAAGIAHEINNPIGFINSNLGTMEQYAMHYNQLLGILNQLEKALKDKDQNKISQVVLSWEKIRKEINFDFIDDDISNLLKESKQGAEKIRKIVLDLRNFASRDNGMMSSVNVEGLMESMLNIAWNEIKYKAELTKNYSKVPLVTCNPQKIGQVFVNLLINAAQAIDKKGVISIKTYVKDQWVCIDISDTGRGIAAEHMTKIFDPFFTTKPVGIGVGLGLSISYDIIRKHGGTITFTSKQGEGTTFTVMMPVQDETPPKEDV